jgi:hypothetical protein
MRDLSGTTMPSTLQPDQFQLDGITFGGLGHRMLKTQNQLTYNTSPSRQTDGSMENINDYDSFILPKVELGFKFIDYETYQNLRRLLLAKRTFVVTYYDKDFNEFVTHEMYAEPDDLTNFFNLGEMIIGSEDFVVRFIATLNEKVKYTATFGSQSEERDWGRSVKVPNGTTDKGYWVTYSNDFYKDIKYKPNDSLNLISNVAFVWESN